MAVLNIVQYIERRIRSKNGGSAKYYAVYRVGQLGAGMVAVLNIVQYIE